MLPGLLLLAAVLCGAAASAAVCAPVQAVAARLAWALALRPLGGVGSLALLRCHLPACPPACLCPQTTFKETTPPEEPLILRSQIVRIKESDSRGNKATVLVRVGGGWVGGWRGKEGVPAGMPLRASNAAVRLCCAMLRSAWMQAKISLPLVPLAIIISCLP